MGNFFCLTVCVVSIRNGYGVVVGTHIISMVTCVAFICIYLCLKYTLFETKYILLVFF